MGMLNDDESLRGRLLPRLGSQVMSLGLVFRFPNLITVSETLAFVFHFESVSLINLLRARGKACPFRVARTRLSNASHTAKIIIFFGIKMPGKGKPSSYPMT